MSVLRTIWAQVWSLAFLVGVLGNLTASGVTAWFLVVRELRKHHNRLAALVDRLEGRDPNRDPNKPPPGSPP